MIPGNFKLLQMAWVFDMNFVPSLRIFKERGYLEALRDALPKTEEARSAYAFVKTEMEKKIRENKSHQYLEICLAGPASDDK